MVCQDFRKGNDALGKVGRQASLKQCPIKAEMIECTWALFCLVMSAAHQNRMSYLCNKVNLTYSRTHIIDFS